ncbi:MAG: hypothetical protein ACOYOD_10440 [Saprospiraceae bacterium]
MIVKNRFKQKCLAFLWLCVSFPHIAHSLSAEKIGTDFLYSPTSILSNSSLTCGCRNVNVVLDPLSGSKVLTPKDVAGGDCVLANASVVVVDDNPLNRDTVDCPGVWTYGLFDGAGALLCWGKVTAEDRSGPLLAEVVGRCNRPVAGSASNGVRPAALAPIFPQALVWRDTFLSSDINKVLNNTQSWDGVAPLNSTFSHLAGGVRFEDACHYSLYCDCRTDVKVNDQITYFQCNTVSGNRVWAKIDRTFIGTDCKGNTSTVSQEIFFVRPLIKPDVCPSEVVLRNDACSANGAEMLLELKKNYFVFTDSLSCNREKYAYFSDAVTAGNAVKVLEDNFSFEVEQNAEYVLCSGRQLLLTVYAMDWCTAGRQPLDTVSLRWGDGTPPVISMPTKPVIVSTSILDCTASLGIDRLGLGTSFGIQITDNCQLGTVSSRIESCVDSVVSGIPVAGKAWRKLSYRTTTVNSRLMALGLPVGNHRLIVQAYDRCNNKREDTLHFVIVDRIAPVMRCESQMNLTLSTSGYTSAEDPFALNGYAKMLASEINKGVSDNCNVAWARVRRAYSPRNLYAFIARGYDSDGDGDIDTNDGVDWNGSGVIGDEDMEKFEYSRENPSVLMSPALDYVEFFCGDILEAGIRVELWGKDRVVPLGGCVFPTEADGLPYPPSSGGNLSYCGLSVVVEDKTAPTFSLPQQALLPGTKPHLVDSLRQARKVSVTSATYRFIEDSIFVAQGFGRFRVSGGDDCQNVEVDVEIAPSLQCGAGTVLLTYTAKKWINGSPVAFPAGSAAIRIQPVHGYDIRFPADASVTCAATLSDTAKVIGSFSGPCDILSVQVVDLQYAGPVVGSRPAGECQRIYRTFTVVNWCQYDEACGDPGLWSVIVPRDPANDGFDGVRVLVRDETVQGLVVQGREAPGSDTVEEIYYEDREDTSLGPDGFTGGTLSVGVNGVPETFERINPTNGSSGRTGSFSLNSALTQTYPRAGSPSTVSVKSTVDIQFNNPSLSGCASATSYFAWAFTQVISVLDTTPPVVRETGPLAFYQDKNNCTASVGFQFSATDACSAQVTTQIGGQVSLAQVQIKANGGPVQDLIVVGGSVLPLDSLQNTWTFRALALPLGQYSLIVRVRDGCGNQSAQRELPFEVRDTSGTAPICLSGLAATLSRNSVTRRGELTLLATDLIASPVYDCNGQGPEIGPGGTRLVRKYYIQRDNGDRIWDIQDSIDSRGFPLVKKTSVTLTCDDLPDSLILLRIYSEDTLGNMAYSSTHVLLSDPAQSCMPSLSAASISGAVSTESKISVEGVEIGLAGPQTMTYRTDPQGAFRFSQLPMGADYVLSAKLDENPRNGVSTFDMVLIQKHILGMQSLDSPYKVIAADVNSSKSVSTLDLIHLRKLILGIDARFSSSPSWRFIPKGHVFTNGLNPWASPLPEAVSISKLAGDTLASFVAVKIGDVNSSVAASGVVRANGSLALHAPEMVLEAGQTYLIPFRTATADLEGFQFTLAFDPSAVELAYVTPSLARPEHLSVSPEEGLIAASWIRPGLHAAAQDTLFVCAVRAKKEARLSEVLQLSGRIAAPEAYRDNGDLLALALYFDPARNREILPGTKFELFQNFPNPCYGLSTSIPFSLPVAGEVVLSVRDIAGRVLYSHRGIYQEGRHSIALRADDIGASGLLFYTVHYQNQNYTRQMVVLLGQ